MTNWNFNMEEAPKGYFKDTEIKIKGEVKIVKKYIKENVIVAGEKNTVTVSNWIPSDERWNMFTKDCPPVAWIPFPKHFLEEQENE